MTDDIDVATTLADAAGRLLLSLQRGAGASELGSATLKARGDRLSQALLASGLAEFRPDDAVLSEEAADDPARLAAERVWIIDPLDGTREFSEGREDWAVHVALWERGELSAAAVGLPALGTVFTSEPRITTWGVPERIRLAVSRSRASPEMAALAEHLEAELVPMGSAGFKACAVIRGEVDAYVHIGGQYEWDSAAPVAVARAMGLFTSRIDGGSLVYNNADPYLPDLLICNPLLADIVLRSLHSVTEGGSPARSD